VVRHGPTIPADRSALPLANPRASRWEQLPLAHRQRLLWLLSQLLKRQLEQLDAAREEDGHDADPHSY
jgi:hypothetical protein